MKRAPPLRLENRLDIGVDFPPTDVRERTTYVFHRSTAGSDNLGCRTGGDLCGSVKAVDDHNGLRHARRRELCLQVYPGEAL
jgi:hypothetical protein